MTAAPAPVTPVEPDPVMAQARADAKFAADHAKEPTLVGAVTAYAAIDARLARARAKLAEIEAEHQAVARHVVAMAGGNGVLIMGGHVVYVGLFNGKPQIRLARAKVIG